MVSKDIDSRSRGECSIDLPDTQLGVLLVKGKIIISGTRDSKSWKTIISEDNKSLNIVIYGDNKLTPFSTFKLDKKELGVIK